MPTTDKSSARSGSETAPERFLDRHLGNAVHLFLSLLAILILIAAAIATVEVVIRDFPALWRQVSEYDALHQIIQNLLLVAIAAELALRFYFTARVLPSKCSSSSLRERWLRPESPDWNCCSAWLR